LKADGSCQHPLTEKALLALEELVQECRYRAPRRSFMIRFTLAYLWSVSRGDREPFDEFWTVLQSNELWRFQQANYALAAIYHCVGVKRDEDLAMRLWHKRQLEEEANRKKAS